MARPRKPWFRKSRNTWYVEVAGKQVPLAKGKGGKAEAMAEFHRLMAAEGRQEDRKPPLVLSCRDLSDLFLARCERDLARSTFLWYWGHLEDWCGRWGSLDAQSVRPLHVSRWLEGREWSDSTRRGAITAVKAMFSWAAKQGHIDASPIAKVERPAMGRRRAVKPEEAQAVLDAAGDEAFRDYLAALWSTGCRPGEIWELTAEGVDLERGVWRLRNKTARRTGRAVRVVPLTPPMVELSRRLVAEHPTGPIFRNADGEPWGRNAIRCRFRRLRIKLGLAKGVVAYGYRHRWATDALKGGLPDQVVAEMLGHSDSRMLANYAHMDDDIDHLRDAARKIRPG